MIESRLGKIILVLISFIVLYMLIVPMFQSLTQKATEDTCRLSVMARSQFVVKTIITGEHRTPLACRTEHLETLSGRREEVKYQIADLMAKCWYMYAEGRVDDIFIGQEEETKMCNICYTFRIPSNMDLGGELYIIEGDQFDDDYKRTQETIKMNEMIGFLMETNYNRGLLYGGSTKSYIGGSTRWTSYQFSFADDQTTRYSRVQRSANSPFVNDIAGVLKQETINKINGFGIKLYDRLGSNLFVVTAQEFNNIDRTAARRLTEQLELNDDESSNSILVMVDMTKGIVRMHAGIEIENHILEGEIEGILHKHFSRISNLESFDKAMGEFIDELDGRIIGSRSSDLENLGLTQRSYYNYITNRLMAPPPIFLPIDSSMTYAIAISSHKGENINKWEHVISNSLAAGVGAGVGAAAGCAGSLIAALGSPICGAVGFVLGATAVAVGTVWYNDNYRNEYDYNNSLVVAPLNALSGVCNIYG